MTIGAPPDITSMRNCLGIKDRHSLEIPSCTHSPYLAPGTGCSTAAERKPAYLTRKTNPKPVLTTADPAWFLLLGAAPRICSGQLQDLASTRVMSQSGTEKLKIMVQTSSLWPKVATALNKGTPTSCASEPSSHFQLISFGQR